MPDHLAGLLAFGPEGGLATGLFWFTALVGLMWLKRHVDLSRGQSEPILREDEPGPPGLTPSELPSVSMIVAAKDEEANIARCVDGLLRQDYPRLQVVVADDRSADRTGAIIDEFAARDPRFTAVHVHELPHGWFGKNNAMREATARATGEWLCYSDADCSYDSPRLISAAVAFALRENAEFLSVLPRLEAGSFWERVVQPAAGAVMLFWFPPQKVNDPTSRRAYANGAFMLLSREAYERLGRHEIVRATLNEDMHLARLAKQRGVRLRVIRGGDLYRVRMYVGFGQIWRGWSRIFYGCFGTAPRLLASVLMLLFSSVAPYLLMLLAPAFGADGPWVFGAGAFTALAQQTVLWRLYHITGAGRPWAMTYGLGSLVCLGMALNAMRRLGGATTTTWRGTTYRGGAQVSPDSAAVS